MTLEIHNTMTHITNELQNVRNTY